MWKHCFRKFDESNFADFVGETDSLTKHEEDLVASALTKSKDNTLKKYYKYISSANIDLSTLQEEIVKFLSTVDAKYCISLYTPRICTFTESYNYLKFDIPFGDMKVNVFLGRCSTELKYWILFEFMGYSTTRKHFVNIAYVYS